MTMALDISESPQHIVLSGVSWSYYEHTLEEISTQPIRVAYLDGMMEIMSILPRHESFNTALGDLIKALTREFRIPRKAFASATFRRQEKSAGSEPDECFYLYDIQAVKGMERFDPLIHRAPDLWIEVDLYSPSLPREPIYARLGVPEVWRYNGKKIAVRLLTSQGVYEDSPVSRAFPFLPIATFAEFISKMIGGDETEVILEFEGWLRTLPRP
jgi:Uma2 family endonuclease